MTIVIGTHAGIWADRRISMDDGRNATALCKLASNAAIVAGFAGDYEAILAALETVQGGEDDPKKLALLNCEGIIVKAGRLYEIDAGRAFLRPKHTKALATGTGWVEALAFLSGRASYEHSDIKAAIRYTSRVRTDCGNGFDSLCAI